jgi:ubiquinone/menaquinone biosynthesis C-methylase UbiE
MDKRKQIVALGYDVVNQNYLDLIESMGPVVRKKYLDLIVEYLPKGSRVLELGCGAGVPMTCHLARYFTVVGVDISREQLAIARTNVPAADFVLADMTKLSFPEETFDAVAAFYCITHVPRDEHRGLLDNIHRILKPGGLFVATMGAGDLPDSIEDWLGAPMFFSHFDGETNKELVEKAGFKIISAEDEWECEYGRPVCFRWFVARK